MLCPYCLENTTPPACTSCKETLPQMYIERQGLFSKAPLILSAVGFSGHGKTVYLAALMYMLNNQLCKIWPSFYRQGLDVDSVRTVQQNLNQLLKGSLPESTRNTFPRPSIHELKKIPSFGTRNLIVYDPPGEAFERDEYLAEWAGFVRRSRAVLFLVSITDLQAPKDGDLFRLLNTYVMGMSRMKSKTHKQHLIVAFTKSDLMKSEFDAYPEISIHLQDNKFPDLANPRAYVQTLKIVSEKLAHYTEHSLGAVPFIRLASQSFKSVAFCAITALGSAPEEERLTTGIEPRGVADPLIWLLDKA